MNQQKSGGVIFDCCEKKKQTGQQRAFNLWSKGNCTASNHSITHRTIAVCTTLLTQPLDFEGKSPSNINPS